MFRTYSWFWELYASERLWQLGIKPLSGLDDEDAYTVEFQCYGTASISFMNLCLYKVVLTNFDNVLQKFWIEWQGLHYIVMVLQPMVYKELSSLNLK